MPPTPLRPLRWGDVPDWAHALARSLLEALRERDPYTHGHCLRVATLARLLARDAGLNEYEQRVVEFSSLFHDLGKMGIPDSVLLKPGRLTPEEAAVMREHPLKSVAILEPLAGVPFFAETLPGVRHHHERVDGAGYPFGISGDAIPLPARIVLIADTFDAITTTRPYREGTDAEFAYRELKLFAGRQFDRNLVEIFLKAHPSWGRPEEEVSRELAVAQRAPRRRAA
jgi:HD-GYP domain-containing protein (c-di-GMP phosphodiesterase class II)